jgi:CHAT domain
MGGQLFGLAGAFLYTGVPTVITSLWPVDDLSTILLMERFYDGYLSGMTPPEALRIAQLWLRDITAGELATRFNTEYPMPYKQVSAPRWQRRSHLMPARVSSLCSSTVLGGFRLFRRLIGVLLSR